MRAHSAIGPEEELSGGSGGSWLLLPSLAAEPQGSHPGSPPLAPGRSETLACSLSSNSPFLPSTRLVSLASTFPSVLNRPLLSSCAKEGAGLAFLKWVSGGLTPKPAVGSALQGGRGRWSQAGPGRLIGAHRPPQPRQQGREKLGRSPSAPFRAWGPSKKAGRSHFTFLVRRETWSCGFE